MTEIDNRVFSFSSVLSSNNLTVDCLGFLYENNFPMQISLPNNDSFASLFLIHFDSSVKGIYFFFPRFFFFCTG